MKVRRPLISLLTVSIFAFVAAGAMAEPALKNSFCLDCHGDKTLTKTNAAGQPVSLFVDKAQLASSVHKTNACVACHIDVTAKHPDDNKVPQRVDCLRCHDSNVKSLGVKAHSAQWTEE